MRTYTHGAIGYLLYARGSAADRRLAVIGGVLPDAILATGFIFHVPLPWPIVSDLHALLHFSWLHTVTIALHSFVVVGPLLALSWLFRRAATPLFVGMLSHGLVDLITHRTWEYNHFFPVPLPPISSARSANPSLPRMPPNAPLLYRSRPSQHELPIPIGPDTHADLPLPARPAGALFSRRADGFPP